LLDACGSRPSQTARGRQRVHDPSVAEFYGEGVLEVLDERSAAVVAGDVEPYWGTSDIHSALGNALTEETSATLYLLYCELTDWFELHEGERARAETEMRAVAADWLRRGRSDVEGFIARWAAPRTRAIGSPTTRDPTSVGARVRRACRHLRRRRAEERAAPPARR
jgi:hypothetical protein